MISGALGCSSQLERHRTYKSHKVGIYKILYANLVFPDIFQAHAWGSLSTEEGL